MSSADNKPLEMAVFCNTCSRGLADLKDNQSRISFVSKILPPFLSQADLFRKILQNIIEKAPYPKIEKPTMFVNEVILHLDPEGLFSLRMFLWRPGEYDPIHDHNSWGVIGPVSGKLEVINYRRLDRDSTSRTRLVEKERGIIEPGGYYHVLPLYKGIHQTGNPTRRSMIQIGIYGQRQTKRNYINTYDLASGRISPLYSPKVVKRQLAESALLNLKNARPTATA
ncbi:MAG: cysteine dioxygenase family protein [Syntrophales bacterium]|jgi:predicted metal-dependent enzyme (double-stranded beta helix superfamily)|nr:cysteine dioxygenase family protein [Syntrophales bacterium]MDY0045170.1 cysteine dioxygenase family protein [Syntrophales bacterium]